MGLRKGTSRNGTGDEKTGNHPVLGKTRIQRGTWICLNCHYKPLDKKTYNCVQCGHDKYGAPGTPLPNDKKPARAGIREGIKQ